MPNVVNKTGSFQAELVSVMMPAFNAETYVERSIKSVLNQAYQNWELIIVDDGSTDRTPEILSWFDDQRIRIFPQENRGEAAARNVALSHSRGRYIAFLDADDEFLPQHLQFTVEYLNSHPEFGGVYSDGHYVDEAGDTIGRLSDHRRGPFEGQIFEELVRASDVFGPPICVVLRRECIEERDLSFDTEITIGPDWDFLISYAEHCDFGYLDHVTCYYRVHGTNISVRTGRAKRRRSLAICREKAINREAFHSCSIETRSYVFYDLLVQLLSGDPSHQSEVILWPEFQDLPPEEQARILRLMAGGGVKIGISSKTVQTWFDMAAQLDPNNPRNRILQTVYKISPMLCKGLLVIRSMTQVRARAHSPFGALE